LLEDVAAVPSQPHLVAPSAATRSEASSSFLQDHRTLALFLVAGGISFLVNQALLAGLYEVAFRQLPHRWTVLVSINPALLLASGIALEVSIIVRFVLNDRWTFRDRTSKPLAVRVWQSHASSFGSPLLCLLAVNLLPLFIGLSYLVANGIGVLAGLIWNWLWSNRIVWAPDATRAPTEALASTTAALPMSRSEPEEDERPSALPSGAATDRWPTAVLMTAVCLAGGLLTWATLSQHRAFNSNGWDLAWFDQIVWNTAHGRFFANSFAPWSFLGEHVEPILLLYALVYRVKADVELLLVSQVAIGVLAAVPLFLAARTLLKSAPAALLVATAFLIAPQFGNAMLFDFHPEVMAVASIFATFALLAERKATWALLPLASAFLLKEDAALVAVGMAWAFWLYGYRRHAGGVVLASAVYFVLVTSVVMPHARGTDGGPQARWDYLGDSGPGIVKGALLHPDRVLNHLDQDTPRHAIASLVAGQGGLLLAGPAVLVVVPLTAAHLLSTHDAEMGLHLHYGILPLALAFVASTMGITYLSFGRRSAGLRRALHLDSRRAPLAFAGLLLVAQLAAAVLSGPFGLRWNPSHYQQTPHDFAVRQAISLVPPEASLAAQSGLLPHVSQRRQVWEFPPAFNADYVLIDHLTWWQVHGPPSPELNYFVASANLPHTGYCLVHEVDGVQLWSRTACEPAPGPGQDAPQVSSGLGP